MTYDIVVPSKWRKEKLDKALNSIFKSIEKSGRQKDFNIYLYMSDKEEYQERWIYFADFDWVIVKYLPKYRVPNFWNDHLYTMGADAMVYMNDDVDFFEDTCANLAIEFEKRFPTGDGVMGIKQDNLPSDQALDSAFGVIGKVYTERFPGKQVWCPAYDRFYADRELGEYAKSINCFYFSKKTKINHYHPAINQSYVDATHLDVRTHLRDDKRMYARRVEEGLLWGKSFKLLDVGEE